MSSVRAVLVCCALLGAGCDQVFGLDDRAATVIPLQEVTSAGDGSAPSLDVAVQPTSAGSTLVVVVAIRTGVVPIVTLADSAGNVWMKALDGPDSLSSSSGRFEIWYATNAVPITTLTLTARDPRVIAASFTEWDAVSPSLTVLAANAPPADRSTTPSTGPVTTTAPALVIAVTAVPGAAVPTLETPGFTVFSPFQGNDLSGSAAFAVVPAGTYDVGWTLPQIEDWTAGIVGFRLN